MEIVDQLYNWTCGILYYGLIALRFWALVDCLVRKAAAFPAAGKQTKPLWAGILVLSGVLGTLFSGPLFSGGSPSTVVGLPALISAVVAAIYLADVRPAVREIAGGR